VGTWIAAASDHGYTALDGIQNYPVARRIVGASPIIRFPAACQPYVHQTIAGCFANYVESVRLQASFGIPIESALQGAGPIRIGPRRVAAKSFDGSARRHIDFRNLGEPSHRQLNRRSDFESSQSDTAGGECDGSSPAKHQLQFVNRLGPNGSETSDFKRSS
jgi:hypothetical protein